MISNLFSKFRPRGYMRISVQVDLHESENESSGDDFTAKRIAEECVNINSGFEGKLSLTENASARDWFCAGEIRKIRIGAVKKPYM